MGIVRGTKLAIVGVTGAILETNFTVCTGYLADLLDLDPLPAAVVWGCGCFVGIVAGDLATKLWGGELSWGPVAGLTKGLVASLVAVVGYLLQDSRLVAESLRPLLGPVEFLGPPGVILIVTIWLGAVLGDIAVG